MILVHFLLCHLKTCTLVQEFCDKQLLDLLTLIGQLKNDNDNLVCIVSRDRI